MVLCGLPNGLCADSPPASAPASQPYDQLMRAASAQRLQRFGQILAAYTAEHGGTLPSLAAPRDLEQLGKYLKPEDYRGITVPHYVLLNVRYLGGGTRPTGPEVAIAYDRTLLRFTGGTNVLFADGRVEFVPDSQVEATGIAPESKAILANPSSTYSVRLPEKWKPYVSADDFCIVGSPFYGVRHPFFAGWPHVRIRWGLENLTAETIEVSVQYKATRVTGGRQTGHTIRYRLSPKEQRVIEDMIPLMSAAVPGTVRIIPYELKHTRGRITLDAPAAMVETAPILPGPQNLDSLETGGDLAGRVAVTSARLTRSQANENLLELQVVNKTEANVPLVLLAAAGDTARTDTAGASQLETSRFFQARETLYGLAGVTIRLPYSVPNTGPAPLLVFALAQPLGTWDGNAPPDENDARIVCWGRFDLERAQERGEVVLQPYEPLEERIRLTEEYRSEHFLFRYRPGSYAEQHVDEAAKAREAAYERLKNVLQMELPDTVTIELYGDMEAKGVGSGTYSTPANTASDKLICEVYNEAYRCDPFHELAHLLYYRIPGRGQLPMRWCLNEAFAEYFEQGTLERLGQIRSALAEKLRTGKLRPLSQIVLGEAGAEQKLENPDLVGCICLTGYLMARDVERCKEFHIQASTHARTADDLEEISRNVLGMSLHDLENQWHEYLLGAGTVPPARGRETVSPLSVLIVLVGAAAVAASAAVVAAWLIRGRTRSRG